MKIIKALNNNVALGLDSLGREVIVQGLGIGFGRTPYEVTDLSKISRTYYNIDKRYLGLFSEVPIEYFEIAASIMDKANATLKIAMNPNMIATLADHIHFSVSRLKDGVSIELPLTYDIQHLYVAEWKLGLQAVQLVRKRICSEYSDKEAIGIALHIINSEGKSPYSIEWTSKLVDGAIKIIEETFHGYVDCESYEYSRFVVHFRYLLKRIQCREYLTNDMQDFFSELRKNHPEAYTCALKISIFLQEELGWLCCEEELLYLMMHINRMTTNLEKK